jgi:hypothetical protein
MERIFGVGTADWGGGRGIGGVGFGYGEREKGGWNRWCAVEVGRLEPVVLILGMEREREKGLEEEEFEREGELKKMKREREIKYLIVGD